MIFDDICRLNSDECTTRILSRAHCYNISRLASSNWAVPLPRDNNYHYSNQGCC